MVDGFVIFEDMQDVLRENLAEINRKIAEAATKAGRNADKVKLVAVSKTHLSAVLREKFSILPINQ